MEIKEFFRKRHDYLHDTAIPSFREQFDNEQCQRIVDERLPSAAWLLWHMARVEDMGLSRLVFDRPQCFDADWKEKMECPIDHYGTSMDREEVIRFSSMIDVDGLFSYSSAVANHTREGLAHLDADTLGQPLDEATVLRVVDEEGMASRAAQWVAPHYVGKDRGWALCHFGLTHNFRHFGQLMWLKKFLDPSSVGP